MKKNKIKNEIPSDAYNLEVFAIKDMPDGKSGKQAFIGYKLPNGNFHFTSVPYTEKEFLDDNDNK